MLTRLCSAILRTLNKQGLLVDSHALSLIAGQENINAGQTSRIEQISEQIENSWQHPGEPISTEGIPTIDDFKDAIEDICEQLNIHSLSIYFDEAAHILLVDQQREFFTLFRDLRSPFITCNAAVYPGTTSYGDVFQPTHDATFLTIDRDILSQSYISNMREIVEKQADSTLMSYIVTHGSNFSVLAYAANGNPRTLLKTLAKASNLSTRSVNDVIREYFRSDIWSEHSLLAERYPGFQPLIDWGRDFIENNVLPSLKEKNDIYLAEDKKTTSFFWVHRNAPEAIKRALELLSYTGLVSQHNFGIKASRGEIGTRYFMNFGCLLSLEKTPTSSGIEIAKNLTPKRMVEFGSSHPSYSSLNTFNLSICSDSVPDVLEKQLAKDISHLDLSQWMIEALKAINLNTVRDILNASESTLKQAYYVGEVRARQTKNTALSAVYEYLSG